MLVDDEPPARRGLRRLLTAHPDLTIVAEAASLTEAKAALAGARPDIVFLDVELGDGKGFEMLSGTDTPTDLVFVTAYSRYAVRAFDVAAVDFLMKPVDPERLVLALQRLRERRAVRAQEQLNGSRPIAADKGRHLLHLPGMRLTVPLKTIFSLAAEGDFTRIALSDGREQLVCRLLGQFEAELPHPPFHRLSRSIMVNLDHVHRVEWTEGGRAQMFLGRARQAVPLGRAAARRLRDVGIFP